MCVFAFGLLVAVAVILWCQFVTLPRAKNRTELDTIYKSQLRENTFTTLGPGGNVTVRPTVSAACGPMTLPTLKMGAV